MLKAASDRDELNWKQAQAQAWMAAALMKTKAEDFPTLDELIGAPAKRDYDPVIVDHNLRMWDMLINGPRNGESVN